MVVQINKNAAFEKKETIKLYENENGKNAGFWMMVQSRNMHKEMREPKRRCSSCILQLGDEG